MAEVNTPQAGAPIRVVPLWVMRIVLGIAGVVLFADVVTRVKPEFRPAWLGVVALPLEGILSTAFVAIAIGGRPAPRSPK
jgi:hypothetical protein